MWDLKPAEDWMIGMKKIHRETLASSLLFSAALFFLLRADGADAQDVHAADANPVVALVQPWVDKNMIPGALVFLAGWSRP